MCVCCDLASVQAWSINTRPDHTHTNTQQNSMQFRTFLLLYTVQLCSSSGLVDSGQRSVHTRRYDIEIVHFHAGDNRQLSDMTASHKNAM